MQIRHTNRELYFKELPITSKDFILPYVSTKKNINKGSRVLAVGCGEGVSQSNRLVWFRKWVLGKQTITDLAKTSGYSSRYLRRWFDAYLNTVFGRHYP